MLFTVNWIFNSYSICVKMFTSIHWQQCKWKTTSNKIAQNSIFVCRRKKISASRNAVKMCLISKNWRIENRFSLHSLFVVLRQWSIYAVCAFRCLQNQSNMHLSLLIGGMKIKVSVRIVDKDTERYRIQ